MTHKIIAALAACSMLLAFSSCNKEESKQDDPKPASEKIVKVYIEGDFSVSTQGNEGATVIGSFSLKSDKKGVFKTLDGSVSKDKATVTYNAADFPVNDVISATYAFDDTKIKDDSQYTVSVHYKYVSCNTEYENAEPSAIGLDDKMICWEHKSGKELKNKGTQTKNLYKIDIDKDGKVTVVPAN